MYRYETHCHTAPVSKCGKASAEETVRFYKRIGYDGIFITNHFLDGNINPSVLTLPYEDQVDFYFSDYEAGLRCGQEIGLKVFPGVELSCCKGTDFLIYGLDKAWYKAHPEIMDMEKSEELPMMMEAGALVIQAHPFREAPYIDHIQLFPRCVHGVEIINSNQAEEANVMALFYAEHYHLLKTGGSDNHRGPEIFEHLQAKGYRPEIAGMRTEEPLNSVSDFISAVLSGKAEPFVQRGSERPAAHRSGESGEN